MQIFEMPTVKNARTDRLLNNDIIVLFDIEII